MDNQVLPWDYKPPSNFRMPPLSIANLKRRIQRPSYVPVNGKGERLPRGRYLDGAQCKMSDGAILDSSPASSPVLHRSKVAFAVTEDNQNRHSTSFTQLSAISPDSPKPMRRPRTASASSAVETLPPVCITADYHDMQYQESEVSDVSSIDLDAMMIELSPKPSSRKDGSYSPAELTIRTSYLHGPDTASDDSPYTQMKSPTISKPAGARLVYLRTCKMLDIPVSQSLYKSLHLSDISLKYHILSQVQFRALAISLAKVTTVHTLNISSTGLTDVCFQYLSGVLKSNYTICELYAADNKLTGLSAETLKEIMEYNVKIEVLDMSGNAFKDADATHFAEIIQYSRNVHKLSISNCNFGDEAGCRIGRAFSLSEALKFCDLSWNQFRKEGAWQLIMQCSVSKSLKELDLSWNGLGLEGCDSLAHFLKVNTTLTDLDITSNRITQEAFRILVRGLVKNSTLQHLKLGKNPITHRGVLEFLAKVKSLQLSGVSSLPSLRTIDFNGILVGGEVMKLEASVREGCPHVHFAFDMVTQDPSVSHSHPKQDYTKLTTPQAKCLLYETLYRIGIDPEYVLPKNGAVKWQVNEFRDTLLAMSVPLTNGAIDLILRKIATSGVVVPSDILNRKTREARKKSCHTHSH